MNLNMHILAQLPPDFWPIVVIILGGVFVFVLVGFMVSTIPGGWGSFAKCYPAKTRPAGNSYTVLGCWFGGYSSDRGGKGVRVIFTDAGIYFYKTFLGRAGSPPFLLPWESVKRVEMGHRAYGNFYLMEIDDDVGKLRLDLPEKIAHDLSKFYVGKNHEVKTTHHEPVPHLIKPGDKAAGTFAIILGVVGVLGMFSTLPLAQKLMGAGVAGSGLAWGFAQFRTARKKKQQESDVAKKKGDHNEA
jgi:hypothetical protein